MKLPKLAGLISMNIIAKNGNKPLPKTATPYKNETIIKKDNVIKKDNCNRYHLYAAAAENEHAGAWRGVVSE